MRLPEAYLSDVHHGYALTGHISQGATVERTYLLATPERGGREWAYVASTRQRVDLLLFALHHEPDRLAAALARSWQRSDAKNMAIDLADATSRSTAVFAAHAELDRGLPERLGTTVAALRGRREEARVAARNPNGAAPIRARRDAQEIGEHLRRVEPLLVAWAARAEVARPTPQTVSVFGRRPREPAPRAAWDRAGAMVETYRRSHSIAQDEPTLLGRRPPAIEDRAAWESTVQVASETLRALDRPARCRDHLSAPQRARVKEQ